MTSLRDRQRQLARQAIVDAVGELVIETRHLDFSIQEVADRAGVSLRTVYNHFPNRESLLDGFTESYNQRMVALGGVMIDDVSTFEEVVAAAAVNFRIFEQLSELTDAWQQIRTPTRAAASEFSHRTERIVQLFGSELPDLSADQVAHVGLVVRHLFSSVSWQAMTRDLGLTTEQVISVTQWAARTLLQAASRGELPTSADPSKNEE